MTLELRKGIAFVELSCQDRRDVLHEHFPIGERTVPNMTTMLTFALDLRVPVRLVMRPIVNARFRLSRRLPIELLDHHERHVDTDRSEMLYLEVHDMDARIDHLKSIGVRYL